MRYWLMKSEPDEMSIDDLARAPKQTTPWFGVRNYVARNFMRDDMKLGDRAFFYHSSCPEPGIAGIVEVSALAYPDASQFDRKSPYFDAKATRDDPRWFNVDVKFVEKTASHFARGTARAAAIGKPHYAEAGQQALDYSRGSCRLEFHRQARQAQSLSRWTLR